MCTLGGPFSSSTGTFRDVGTGLGLRAARQRLLCCLTLRDFDDGVELRRAGLFFSVPNLKKLLWRISTFVNPVRVT
jgi:hypothetical protein